MTFTDTPGVMVSATNFSFSWWMKYTSNDVGSVIEFYTSINNMTRVYISAGVIQFQICNGANAFGRWSSLPKDTTWRFWTCVYDGGGSTNADKCKIYVDGVSKTLTFDEGSIPSSTSSTSSHTYNHTGKTTVSTYLKHTVDELAIWDYSLSSGNVTTLYNSGSPTDLDNSGITAPVHMGEGSDDETTVYDVGTTGGENLTGVNLESGDFTTDVP
jgi:hypothetical protein